MLSRELCVDGTNGKLYCYDPDTNKIVELYQKDVMMSNVPVDVVNTLMKVLYQHGGKAGGNQRT